MLLPLTKLHIQQLVDHWLESGIAMGQVSEHHCLSAVTGLVLITESFDRTKWIVMPIIAQALERGYSSAWVLIEVQFEAQALTAGNRADWLRSTLAQGVGDDAALDNYNLRLHRFALK